MSKSPLQIIKERFGDDPAKAKAKLVEAVKKAAGKELWLDALNETKGLEHVSNKKLLHLEQVFEAVSKDVGSRDKLVAELAELQGRGKDEPYKLGLAKSSTPKLWDELQAARARAKKSSN
jgi:hypothetical protein